MSPRSKAFATLAAVGLLVLTIALVAGSVLGSQQLLVERSRAEAAIETGAQGWKVIDAILDAVQTTWNADAQSLDLWWAEHSQFFPQGTVLVSLSGRVNLNSVTPFLLQNSELNATLLGKSVEDFTTYRTNKGPFADIEAFKDYFRPDALNQLYCAQSCFDINAADEIMLEKILALRTGSESLASTVRARVREYRTNHQVFAESDWETLIGAEKDSVGDLVSTEPELDVNTAPAAILQAVLRDPDFKLDQPDAKLQVIVAGRAAKPWDQTSLRQALGVDKNSPILQYLGTRCRFIQGEVPLGSSTVSFIAFISYSTDSPPKLTARIIGTAWSSS